jgi:hypothetical protein
MKTVVGTFVSESAADRATRNLINAGISPARIRRLTPESSEREIHAAIPTTETEQAGMGRAVGGLVGGVVGAMLVLTFVAIASKGAGAFSGASYLLTALGAGLFAVAGAFAGGALEDRMFRGLPKDEIYFYEEALRRGRSVVFVFAGTRQEEIVRKSLGGAGASLDAGDESWKVGIQAPDNVHGRAGRRAS